jgi:hypothetical protein
MSEQLANMCYLVHFKTREYADFRTDIQPKQQKALAEFAEDMYNAASFAKMIEKNMECELSDEDFLKFYNLYRSNKSKIMFSDE